MWQYVNVQPVGENLPPQETHKFIVIYVERWKQEYVLADAVKHLTVCTKLLKDLSAVTIL